MRSRIRLRSGRSGVCMSNRPTAIASHRPYPRIPMKATRHLEWSRVSSEADVAVPADVGTSMLAGAVPPLAEQCRQS